MEEVSHAEQERGSSDMMTKQECCQLLLDSGFDGIDRYLRAQLDRLYSTYCFLKQHWAVPSQAVIVDMGGGSGIWLPLLQALGGFSAYHIVDYPSDGPAELIVKTPSGPITVRLHKADLESDRVGLPDASADVVMMCEVLEHLSHDPMHALLEANRILKPGGLLFLSTPNADSAEALRRMLRGRHPGQAAELWPRKMYYFGHRREYAPDELRTLLAAAGFRIEQLETDAPVGILRFVMMLLRMLMRMKVRKAELGETVFLLSRVEQKVCESDLPVDVRYPAPVYATGRFKMYLEGKARDE